MNTENLVAKHVKNVPPSGIRKFFDIASERKDAISLGVGEPDFITPWNIREKAINSIERGRTHYTSNHGSPDLRRAVLDYLEKRFGVYYNLNQCMITVGASEALDLVFRAILEPGDEVLIPAPSYVSYEPGVTFAHGIAVGVETYEKDEFILTPESIERAVTPHTKAIVIPYPNNPTGGIMTKEQLDAIKPVIVKHDLFVISDEIYAELTYGGLRHASIAENFEDRTLLINGFSKAFAMTGWRLGYACGPKPIIDAMVKIHQYSMLCAPIMSQDAGLEALTYEMHTDFEQVRNMTMQYDRRRLLIVDGFRQMGLSCFEPRGAFYAFPNITSTGLSSEEFCTRLLNA
ncbi:MAG: aminotransferase class I/II-fold pyridoxal phosphate-dependent enzyme, partial [Christensenellaceae bacterium]|nr:aminotransferase class I/II-fold pyridoxal phosphate-dependent enzyme [Christensenellaceae bacterium]